MISVSEKEEILEAFEGHVCSGNADGFCEICDKYFELMDTSTCSICGGTGEITLKAFQREGDIQDEESRSCICVQKDLWSEESNEN